MYSTQPNGADSATINPAALASAELGNVRGLKRSRSPDYQSASHPGHGGDDDGQPNKKRGKPMKSTKPPSGISETPIPPPVPPGLHNVPSHASQIQHAPSTGGQQPASYQAPAQSSPPPKTTPAKSTLKALPTVRDHTTDQLGPGEDEYLPREFDEAGEKKVMNNGQLLGGREYRCRTFLVPNRGDKLFMLATECARILGYRDSYLLFNKNRSLFKIIASQVEKDDLVTQEILPFSYRSRQIAIVTARSMFRQFGSRVITGGRRVRDDYWETKARKQGFTEADPAGEKRPGASKAREAAAEASQNAAMLGGPHGEIVYSNTPGQLAGAPQPQFVQPGMIGAPPGSSTRMPVITPGPDYNDTRSRDYSSILKTGPRQEITGPAYQDRTQPTPIGELHTQAHHAAEYNRTVNHQRDIRSDYMGNYWRRTHDQPAAAPLSQAVGGTDTVTPSSRPAPSSHTAATGMPQSSLISSQSPQMMMSAAPYSQPISSQNTIQPPMRTSSGAMPQPQGYNQYPQSSQMWPQTPQTPQYSYTHPSQAQASPHQQPAATPQMRGSNSQVAGSNMPYSGMPGMSQGYPSQGQGMSYDQTPRQYMHQGAAGAPAVTQSWSGQQPQTSPQWWANQPQ